MARKRRYGLFVETTRDFDDAAQALRDACKAEGFGILWEIDVRKTMKEKLSVDMQDYIIFGACNPPIAYKAMTTEPDIGLLLPCNFIARREKDYVVLGGIFPDSLLGLTGRDDMAPMVEKVRSMVEAVLDNAK